MLGKINYHELFELASDAMFILDQSHIIREINQVAYTQLGYSKAEMIGRRIADFIPAEYAALIKGRYTLIQNQGYLIYESAMILKDGSVLSVEISNRSIDLGGEMVFFAVVRDIRERKHIAQALLESERDLKQAQTIGHFGNWAYDKQGSITWSEGMYKIFGVTPDTFSPNAQNFNELIHPADLPGILKWNDASLAGLKPAPIEYRCIRPDRTVRYIYGHVERKLDSEGKFSHLSGTIQDITELKQAELKFRESENKWRLLFENMTNGFALHEVICDKKGKVIDYRFIEVNPAYEKLTTLKAIDIIGHTVLEILPGTEPYWIEIFGRVAMTGEPTIYENYSKELGRWYHVSVFCPKSGQFAVIVSDITERKKVQESLENALEFSNNLINSMQDGFSVLDTNGCAKDVNLALCRMTGFSKAELLGLNPPFPYWPPEEYENIHAAFQKTLQNEANDFELIFMQKSGRRFPVIVSPSIVKDSKGNIISYTATVKDISERKQAEARIEHLAYHDQLTRLPNRQLLLDRLNQALVSSLRTSRTGALLFIDLDNFKNLNDTQGHDIGDLLLKEVAQRLESCVRIGDTVARLGGDEFVVMLIELNEQVIEAASQAENIGEKILTTLRHPYQLRSQIYRCSASIGVTLFGDNQQTIDGLMKQADIAMYQAKKSGRNTLRFFDQLMQENIGARVLMENELHQAIANHQFELYYQVQVDSLNRPLGAEALIRWMHPERNMISPAQFIPLAEETGLILKIGKWVLEAACAQIKAWQPNDKTNYLVIAVNVSAKQFRQTDFVAQVQASLQRHGVNPRLLKLELTESLLQENIDDTIATMSALNKIGVKFSLDDFGSGYSSLQYLKRLPLDQLKIDQAFVRDIASDNNDKTIVRTIIAMAQSMDLEVIAEGVETDEQRKILLNQGCTHYQGYLFGKPVPIGEFEAGL